VQAIHETGSRITHDVKNLLQSLRTLCAAAESKPESPADFQALMQRQLPAITQRLQGALDKLQKPRDETIELNGLSYWWQNLKRRYASNDIDFVLETIDEKLKLPKDLFDSVSDNLLQNALKKRKAADSLRIQVTLTTTPHLILRVCDDGEAIDSQLAKLLFHSPISSTDGYGIGLYQMGRQAQRLGYQLYIAENQKGKVCFELSAGNS
jgi:K+-sensing histidine kinase KdpD